MFFVGNKNSKNKALRLLKKIIKNQQKKEDSYNGKPNLVILSGAGISQESGIETFRSSDGLWNNYNINDVASISGYKRDPKLVVDFYNKRRLEVDNAKPNEAHHIIAELESHFNVTVVTQNIDDLHERAGSSNIYHLHGELHKVQANGNDRFVYEANGDQDWQERCPKTNAKLRPYVVWFGERPRFLLEAQQAIMKSDVVIIVGTSLNVFPAAGLIDYIPKTTKFFIIDPNMPKLEKEYKNLKWFEYPATKGFKKIHQHLIDFSNKHKEEKESL